MKKAIAIIISILMILSVSSAAFAAEDAGKLRFDENGEFKIMHLTDVQEDYPMSETVVVFIHEAIQKYKPDLVVLGGDNCVCEYKDKDAAIKDLCDIFVSEQTKFTLVFGNHDHQQGMEKEALLKLYQKYGGEYCLAYDAVPELFGVGTHNLPIYASDGTDKVNFNLWLMDSNNYANDENGNNVGYDCVHEDQIEWYKTVANQLKEENGGEAVSSFVFQHICVQEVFDELFLEVPKEIAVQKFDKKGYSFIPLVHNIKDGYLLEFPCPGYYNYGQFNACVEQGDVVAMFFGHDHINTYTVEKDGIDLVCTAGCTYSSYGDVSNRGCRMLTVYENNPKEYKSECVVLSKMALEADSKIAETEDTDKFVSFWGLVGEAFFNIYVKISRLVMFPVVLLDK